MNQSEINVSQSCIVLDVNTTIPWNNAENLVSLETEEHIYRIKSGILIPLFFILGTPANVLNMVVFYKQGLKERINVCLFTLALVDLLHLFPVFVLYSENIYSQFTDKQRHGPFQRFMLNNNLIGFYGFGYGSMLMAAIIATERCVCVLFPLHAQRCVPTGIFTVVMLSSVCIVSFLRFAVTAQIEAVCFYEMKTERFSWRAYFSYYYFKNRAMIGIVDGIFYGFCLSLGCPAVVLLTTITTAIRLRQTVQKRSQISSSVFSSKEIGVTRMLFGLSIEFLVLSIPVISLRISRTFPPYISHDGYLYHFNIFNVLVSLTELSFYASSSVNFVVYYTAGTKYRQTLHALLGIR